MKKFRLICLLAALAAVVSLSSPAQAQISTQKYASPAGTGTMCSPSAPCSLAFAIFSAPVGGTVSCIDGGSYQTNNSPSTSITIDCPGAVLTSSGGPALGLTGTSSQVVILRNLTFDGGLQTSAPFIAVTGGATLIIENCKFQNIATGNAIAIQYLPNAPASQLIIRDTVFANNGISPSSGGGLQVAPQGGSASVVLERVSFNLNVTSMVLSGPVNATMVNSTVSASRSNGILVGSGATLDVKGSTLVYNVGSAIRQRHQEQPDRHQQQRRTGADLLEQSHPR
jgi:Right handed beta helix region